MKISRSPQSLVLIVSAALAGISAPLAAVPRVSTAAGQLEGIAASGTEAFLGIPYAAPPVGAGRWRAPQPALPWKGVRAAAQRGPACQQAIAGAWGPYSAEFIAAPPVSEDCLTLNLWRPARVGKKPLPVLVFIHGGAYQGGSGNMPLYDGARLAARGAVVVTINYRLGVFGFLAHPALTAEDRAAAGNYGLLDQIAALRWIKAHAARFGGDPAQITVAGESAGAASVNNLMVAPAARGLFQRAISLSGASMAIELPDLAQGEAAGSDFAAQLGGADLATLRTLPAERLIAASAIVPAEGGRPRLVFVPHRDGRLIPHDPTDATAAVASPVPLLSGFNAAEMIDPAVRSPAAFEAAVRARYGAFADRLLALYPHATEAEAIRANGELARDRYMAGLLIWSRARTAAHGQRVFAYLYDHAYPPVRGGQPWGAFHSSGLPYLFGTIGLGDRVFTAADRVIVRQWQDRVLAFARTGDPRLPQSPWPAVTSRSATVMGLGDSVGPRPAVSTPERLAVLQAYAAAGGTLGLM
ncbi:carboxylesterase/lipase family protein [Novosphingobium piscinae]|uniref:Carboxylic ester hydrolase n=1 Tax=Novosphingobium piscinae TaxID=1507448 RepID=A0A7X1FXS7_9SPHN|nr:carboxylesterase family protein [Novosphingobium piscinae]MBC2668844.1 carboxylesterase family protein [Novosphingobium piscinae]